MLKFLKNNNPAILVLIPVVMFLLSLKHFTVHLTFSVPEYSSLFAHKIFIWLNTKNGLITASILSGLLIVVATFIYLNLLGKYIFFEARNFFHGFIFILLAATYFSPFESVPVLIALILFILALKIILGAAKKQNAVFDFFNVGFIIATGSLFWFNLIYFYVIIFASLIIMRRIVLREWISALLGLFTPYYIYLSVEFIITGKIDSLFTIDNFFIGSEKSQNFTLPFVVFFIFAYAAAFVSGLKILSSFNILNINLREYYKIFTWINFLALAVLFTAPSDSSGALFFVFTALTIPVTVFFNFTRRPLIIEIFFDIMIILIILIQLNFNITFNY